MVAAAAVRELIDTGLTDDELRSVISGAEIICTSAWAAINKSPARPLTDLIITYMAAHLCALREPPVTSETFAGGLSVRYDANPRYRTKAESFRSTIWGQTALALDSTGALARMSSDGRPTCHVLNNVAAVA